MANGISESFEKPTEKLDFFGHPRGLATLFFTEMWERFSYYGMRALLILFMTAETFINNPGLGFEVGKAAAIYGLYTSMVYLLTLAGGWVADNLWGQRKAVFVGGCIIAAGHFTMAGPIIGLPDLPTFFGGLVLIVIGTGLLKPNVSTMVGDLYPEPTDAEKERGERADWGARRDAGFSIFYMGINIGAILGPTICSFLGEGYNYHLGFSAAGFGMVLGLIQYKLGAGFLGDAGYLKTDKSKDAVKALSRKFYGVFGLSVAVIALFVSLATSGVISVSLSGFAEYLGYAIIALAVFYFVYLIGFCDYSTRNKKRLGVIFWLFILAALFWSGFEQAGSSLNLFARDLTDRFLGPSPTLEATGQILPTLVVLAIVGYIFYRIFKRENLWWGGKAAVGVLGLFVVGLTYYLTGLIGMGWEMPAGWLQNINPLFIVIFAPWLAHRNSNPSIPVKFALGLVGLAAGFFVLSWGAANATAENPVSPAWLIVTYFLHTCGELALSPVGLSSITKLAPKDRVGQMMGVWFVAAALGNLFAGLVAGQLEDLAPSSLFWNVALIAGGAGVLAMLAAPKIKQLMGNVD